MRWFMKSSFIALLIGAVAMPALAVDYMYELTAQKVVPGLSGQTIDEQRAVVDETLDRLVAAAEGEPGLEIVVGTNGADRTAFPPVDLNMDGTPDNVGKMVEVWLWSHSWFLTSTDLAHGIGLPWTIVAYSNSGDAEDPSDDTVDVVIGVPETFTRLFFRGEPNADLLESVARCIHHPRLRYLVHRALQDDGYATNLDQGIPETEMGEAEIAAIEALTGRPLSAEVIAPSLTLRHVKVAEVVAALEQAVVSPTVGDLNQDGEVDDDLDEGVLPYMVQQYMAGNLTFEEIAGALAGAFDYWSAGYTFQQWQVPRVLDLSHPILGKLYIIELCQPFYAGTALSTGLHHMPSMPCAIAVWQVHGGVKVSLLDTSFIFAYFFADAPNHMPPPMLQLFGVFPTLVFNDMAAVVNSATTEILGLDVTLDLHPFPGM